MREGFSLPKTARIGGREYLLHTDFRDILEIFRYFQDPELPQYLRWRIALGLFYEGEIPPEHHLQAMEYLADFLSQGEPSAGTAANVLLDWQRDSHMIISEVNRAAGTEIRSLPYVHWWTFLGWFHTIGQGQLSTVVSIRDKLRRGKKLEDWEKEFYRENKARVELKKRYTREEQEEMQRLQALLEGKEEQHEQQRAHYAGSDPGENG